ncbi:MAG: hypothetical protein FWC68_01535 [Oscillospiraceae bacterium]|nr:hypothetical protein [Oscillospiraceae bacterium]
MTVHIKAETEIDLNIRKVEEILKKLQLLEDKSKMLTFITIQEFAQLRKCSIATSQKIFNLEGFPSESIGKNKVVELNALRQWYQKQNRK